MEDNLYSMIDSVIEKMCQHLENSPFDEKYIEGINALANLIIARATYTTKLCLRESGSYHKFNHYQNL